MEKPSIEQVQEFCFAVLKGASEIAMDSYGKGRPELKFDFDLVTKVETEIDNFMRDEIGSKYGDTRIFQEGGVEGEYKHGASGLMWVFDALDGVANYQAGIPLWGLSIALVENFWPIFGAYYMPATEDMFWAFADNRAYHNGEPIEIVEAEPTNNESLLFTYSRFHDHFTTIFPGKIRNLGCTGGHICYVAKGRADGAILHNVSYRDLLAPAIILEAAGGSIEYIDGRRFDVNEFAEKPCTSIF